MNYLLFEPLREWVEVSRRSKGSKKPSSRLSVEGARVLRSGDGRHATASGEINRAAEPLSSLGSIGSPEASWFNIKQLTEPLPLVGELTSTSQI